MAKFKKGDICEIVKTYRYPELLGAEVTIMGEPEEYEDDRGDKYFGYPTDLRHDGRDVYPIEDNLRLKDHPTDLAEIVYGALLDRMTGKVAN